MTKIFIHSVIVLLMDEIIVKFNRYPFFPGDPSDPNLKATAPGYPDLAKSAFILKACHPSLPLLS